MAGYWTEQSRPIIARVLAQTAGQEERAIRKALAEAYPFQERRGWAYKAWLLEVQRQRGLRERKRTDPPDVDERQLTLLEED